MYSTDSRNLADHYDRQLHHAICYRPPAAVHETQERRIPELDPAQYQPNGRHKYQLLLQYDSKKKKKQFLRSDFKYVRSHSYSKDSRNLFQNIYYKVNITVTDSTKLQIQI